MTSYKSYKDLLVDKNTNFTYGGNIPKIIFKTSWQTELPKEIMYCLEKTKKLNKAVPQAQAQEMSPETLKKLLKKVSIQHI
jgi:mannosyltransferase OCH1-like enzyme